MPKPILNVAAPHARAWWPDGQVIGDEHTCVNALYDDPVCLKTGPTSATVWPTRKCSTPA